MKHYKVEYDKDVKRWGVYTADDWLCDCIDKETAKLIAGLLNNRYNGGHDATSSRVS